MLRPLTALAVLLASAAAGCLNTGPAATGDAPAAAEDLATGNLTGLPVDVDVEHDYREAPETVTFDVPELAAPVTLYFRFMGLSASPGGPEACASRDASLTVLDPAGAVLARGAPPRAAAGNGACATEHREDGLTLAPGTYAVEFAGSGLVTGVLHVQTAGMEHEH